MPQYISQVNPQAITLIPFMEGSLVLSMFLKPMAGLDQPLASDYSPASADTFNVVPQFMLMQFGEAIAAGALRRILSLPNQTWTDQKMAMQYGARFDIACDNNFRHQMKGQHRAPSRARATYF